jgi:hypothetical protein
MYFLDFWTHQDSCGRVLAVVLVASTTSLASTTPRRNWSPCYSIIIIIIINIIIIMVFGIQRTTGHHEIDQPDF